MSGREWRVNWEAVAADLAEDPARPGGPSLDAWVPVFAALEELRECEPPADACESTAAWLAGLPMPGAFRRRMAELGVSRPRGFWSALAVIRSQTSVFSLAFWAVAASVITLASVGGYGVLTAGVPVPAGAPSLPLTLVAPLVGSVGVAYALRSFGRGPWEVELSCPITPVGMALGRLFIVFAYTAGLASVASGAVWLGIGPSGSPGPFLATVFAWLGPLALWSALAFYFSLRFSPATATAVSLGFWAVEVALLAWRPAASLLVVPGRPGPAGAPTVSLGAAVLLALLAVREAGRSAERVGRSAA